AGLPEAGRGAGRQPRRRQRQRPHPLRRRDAHLRQPRRRVVLDDRHPLLRDGQRLPRRLRLHRRPGQRRRRLTPRGEVKRTKEKGQRNPGVPVVLLCLFPLSFFLFPSDGGGPVRRVSIDPRPNWQKEVEKYGFMYHTLRGEPYWDETAFYQFTAFEIDTLELATQTLHQMCLDLV